MKLPSIHDMVPVPEGLSVGDVLPVFSSVDKEVVVGKKNSLCASCGKPFTAARKRRKAVRMYPVSAVVPMAFSYDICGQCVRLHQGGGVGRDAVLAAVQAFCEGGGWQ